MLFSFRFSELQKLIVLVLLIILGDLTLFAVEVGDYRSRIGGYWSDPATWEVFDGATWQVSTKYPGEEAGDYVVTIEQNHTITIGNTGISTQQIGEIVIKGKLLLQGDNNGVDFNLNTQFIYVVPNLPR